MNCVIKIILDRGGKCMTPSDVSSALVNNSENDVRLAVLEIFGRDMRIEWEDFKSCAYIAYLGRIKPLKFREIPLKT